MAKKQGILYVFDIENKQEQYAKCLEFISILHHTDVNMTKQQRLTRICDLADDLDITGDFVPNLAKNYYEQPLKSGGKINIPIVSKAKRVEAKNIQNTILSNDSSMLHFHIRIHPQVAEKSQSRYLTNLQYLALFLQRIKQIGETDIFKRLSIFIVPRSDKYYPFLGDDGTIDFETCKVVSHYLRLLSKEYTGIIYGVQQKGNETVVRALDFSDPKRYVDYFPLIPLTEKTYSILFDEILDTTIFEALCSLNKKQRFQKAADKDPYTAMSSFILETAFQQLTSTLASYTPNDKTSILQLISKELSSSSLNKRMRVISFSIFLFTLRIDCTEILMSAESVRSVVRQNLEFAIELCGGLRQLAQNTLQHSVSHEGVFSFYLEHSRNEASVSDEIKVFLSDYNDKQSFVDNFVLNIQKETCHTDNLELKESYLELIKQKDAITLGDFFGEYGKTGPGTAWRGFRKADSSAHIGLLLFSLVMQRCKGHLTLINSTDYSVDPKNIFYHSYSNDVSEVIEVLTPERYIIPGTQLVLAIPVGAIENTRPRGMGQLSLPHPIHEDYDTFAKYLECQSSEIVFCTTNFNQILQEHNIDPTVLMSSQSISDTTLKYKIIHCWEIYWRKYAPSFVSDNQNHFIIHYLNTEKLQDELLNSSDRIEFFIKGFINALDSVCPSDRNALWAFTNVSDSFLNILRQISIVLAPKSFPVGLQLYVVAGNLDKSIHLLGDTFSQAVTNAYMLSIEHGTQAFSLNEVKQSQSLYEKTMSIGKTGAVRNTVDSQPALSVCPFDVILSEPGEGILSIFDRRILQLADRPIDEFPSGCKLDHIHMRLGSKVHIHAFYEMAFMFYRTSVANRVAFEILKDLITRPFEKPIDLKKDNLLFYGYASYSKALLTSIQELLRAYRRVSLYNELAIESNPENRASLQKKIDDIPSHMALASYQHNLQTEFQADDTELYFDFFDSTLGEIQTGNESEKYVHFNRTVKIIQIVPISSTLTTFDKMDQKLKSSVLPHYGVETVARYTVFWVTDAKAANKAEPRPETEAKYWTHVELCDRRIRLNPRTDCVQNDIFYFMRSPVVWEDPLNCELCYPTDVIGEVPLVETDQTSTVPTQQVRSQHVVGQAQEDHHENDERLLALKSCVAYGHFRRENNHFQFYLETQSYFNKVSKMLPQWLMKLREQDRDIGDSSKPVLNIIFSPEHTTNVGFAQYVNNYYFMGSAEIVCVNEDKEFRSNFKCEHMALIHTIEDLLNDTSEHVDLPVRFYFVDDTIISGDTFHKANSFLRSLIPARYQSLFPANLIRKCFVLVDRLSRESKQAYVRDVEKDFLSYLHIDLSNMRTQGDSCVVCKLKNNAETLLKRSATQNIAEHWHTKASQYLVHRYNKNASTSRQSDDRAFRKLVLSHISQNVLFHDNVHFELGDIYDSVLTIIAEILGVRVSLGVSFQYGLLMQAVRKSGILESLKDFLKLISRPFFSFDFKVRLQALTLMLIFVEFLINEEEFNAESLKKREELHNNPYKDFLFENTRIDETFRLLQIIKDKYLNTKELQIDFMQDCLVDNLVELRSTYLMRKATMMKMYHFLLVKHSKGRLEEHEKAEAFWKEYVAGIHKILACNSDETKALWLEHLLITGEEYGITSKVGEVEETYPEGAAQMPKSIFQVLTTGTDTQYVRAFRYFCNELFLQNNRVLFDGIENHKNSGGTKPACSMEYWTLWQRLDNYWEKHVSTVPSVEEVALFDAVSKVKHSDHKVKERYDDLLNKIAAMGKKKYGFSDTDIALITILPSESRAQNETIPKISDLDFVSWKLDSTVDSYFNKYEIKCKLIKSLSDDHRGFSLKNYGYILCSAEDDQSSYMFVSFKSDIYPIVPVYLYFSFRTIQKNELNIFMLQLFLRDILSYRNHLLQTLQNDFAGDIFPKYAHTAGEKSILAHEKATSHNTIGDDRVTLEVFVDPKSTAKYEIIDSNQVLKWLLLHNYTNAQIAKLFNRSYRGREEYDSSANFPVPPPLYPRDALPETMQKLSWFERPLRSFSDLRLLQDGRFALLDSVVTLSWEELKDVRFLVGPDNDSYYNIEYFKSILIDIIISAMKYATSSATYLERVDKYLKDNSQLRHSELLRKRQSEMLNQQKCVVTCLIDRNSGEPFDYLIIRNRVNKLAHNLFDWEKHNQIIKARLENPIDYADGHMSLLAISQYIEGLWPEKLHGKTSFAYVEMENKQLYFETKLPVIKKED